MFSFLYKSMPLLISMALSIIIYPNIDKKYKLTKKISSYINIKQELKACFCACCTLLFILIIGVLGVYVICIPNFIYYILIGIIAGIGSSIAINISPKSSI